jgi:hypothetical protein
MEKEGWAWRRQQRVGASTYAKTRSIKIHAATTSLTLASIAKQKYYKFVK